MFLDSVNIRGGIVSSSYLQQDESTEYRLYGHSRCTPQVTGWLSAGKQCGIGVNASFGHVTFPQKPHNTSIKFLSVVYIGRLPPSLNL